MKQITFFVFAAVSLFGIIGMCGCLDNNDHIDIIMAFEEFVADYNQSVDNESKIIVYWFNSLDPGDILALQDTINDVTYNTSVNYSRVEFISLVGSSFPIQGDITALYGEGDTVEIILHIIAANFTDINPYTLEEWTFEIETFREGWDDSINDYIPVSQKYMRQISR